MSVYENQADESRGTEAMRPALLSLAVTVLLLAEPVSSRSRRCREAQGYDPSDPLRPFVTQRTAALAQRPYSSQSIPQPEPFQPDFASHPAAPQTIFQGYARRVDRTATCPGIAARLAAPTALPRGSGDSRQAPELLWSPHRKRRRPRRVPRAASSHIHTTEEG